MKVYRLKRYIFNNFQSWKSTQLTVFRVEKCFSIELVYPCTNSRKYICIVIYFIYVIAVNYVIFSIGNENCIIHNSFTGALKIFCYIRVQEGNASVYFSNAVVVKMALSFYSITWTFVEVFLNYNKIIKVNKGGGPQI